MCYRSSCLALVSCEFLARLEMYFLLLLVLSAKAVAWSGATWRTKAVCEESSEHRAEGGCSAGSLTVRGG